MGFNLAVVGAQWGDEGKGRVMELLIPGYMSHGRFDVTARYQGGPNAGHTIYVEGVPVVLHSLPSGVLYEGLNNVMGNGVVVNPALVKAEIDGLRKVGINAKKGLHISHQSPVILPHHIALEYVRSQSEEIDTTKHGIVPCYAAHAERMGAEVTDFFNSARHAERLIKQYDDELRISNRFQEAQKTRPRLAELNMDLDPERTADRYMRLFDELGSCVEDTVYLMNSHIRRGYNILFEGAQGTLLDRDHGTYPFVTSSSTVKAGVGVGLGVDPGVIDHTIGVMKAGYMTRVGNGFMVTELGDPKSLRGEEKLRKDCQEFLALRERVMRGTASDYELGRYMRVAGGEYGATTGRPRRTGWPDLVALDYAIMFGIDSLILTKLDVTDHVPEIKVCTEYKNSEGNITCRFDSRHLESYRPVYHAQKGWMTDPSKPRNFDELPPEAKELVATIEQFRPVDMICVGPEGHQTINKAS